MKYFSLNNHLIALVLVLGLAVLLIRQPKMVGAQGSNNSLDAADGDPQNAVFVNTEGDVGIGTTNPQAHLHVRGKTLFDFANVGIDGVLGIGTTNPQAVLHVRGRALFDFANVGIDGNLGVGTTNPQAVLHVRGKALFDFANVGIDGKLGVGTTNPQADLHVRGKALFDHANIGIDGIMGIGTTNPQSTLHVVGTTRTSVLEITGGADLAEPFVINEADIIEPGTVVVLAPNSPGELRISNGAYDPLVAGVISGAGDIQPGLIMQQEEAASVNGEMYPVALTGKVYVKAVGPIQVGDLLTTSDVPGHAMAATDRDQAFGATLGKAMSPLDVDETGLVLVLVALQ